MTYSPKQFHPILNLPMDDASLSKIPHCDQLPFCQSAHIYRFLQLEQIQRHILVGEPAESQQNTFIPNSYEPPMSRASPRGIEIAIWHQTSSK